MSSRNRNIIDGVNQLERVPHSLASNFFQFDDRTVLELYERVYQVADKFAYYDINGTQSGTWQALLEDPKEIPTLLENLSKSKGSINPHIALILSFLELIQYHRRDLNSLLDKHLDAYYKRFLGFTPRKATPDQVHVFFSLKKNIPPIELKIGTKIEAGTDNTGKKILFKTNNKLIVNSAKIERLKTIYFDKEHLGAIYAAPVANSVDGLGSNFKQDKETWPLFGPNNRYYSESALEPIEGNVGFALSSPMFLMSGGERTLTMNVHYEVFSNIPIQKVVQSQISVELSGEKGWISPHSTEAELLYEISLSDPLHNLGSPRVIEDINPASFAVGSVDYLSPFTINEERKLQRTLTTVVTSIQERGLTHDVTIETTTRIETFTPIFRIKAVLTAEMPPVVIPENPVYPEGPKADWPICRVRIIPSKGESIYLFLRKIKVKKIELEVNVRGLKTLTLENNQSTLNPDKSFLPFGPKPFIGGSFYIGSPELAYKGISDFSLDILWDQAPQSNLSRHYYTYDDEAALESVADVGIVKFNENLSVGLSEIVNLNKALTGNLFLLQNRKWVKLSENALPLFGESALNINTAGEIEPHRIGIANLSSSLNGPNYTRKTETDTFVPLAKKANQGFIEIRLEGPIQPIRAFGHEDFNTATIKAAIHNSNPLNASQQRPFPPLPYTPAVKEIGLNYMANHVINFDQPLSVEKFFHLEPFGYFIPKVGTPPNLFPNFEDEGNLFIGLSGLLPPQQLSILFQLEEGSAEPEPSFSPTDVSWSYLSNDLWVKIPIENILMDTTNGFKTSGIIELLIGSDASQENTRFLDDLFWLKASLPNKSNGASQVINLHAQAVAATRILNETQEDVVNEKSDTISGLILAPNHVKNLEIKNQSIAKIHQPYSSFAGKQSEQSVPFISRVAERLRHKQRAITNWDFERIILEAFPSIFKVKCLPHTMGMENHVPGSVTIVVVSNLRNKAATNPFQPRSSSILLAQVKEYISNFTSPFVTINVENPTYEQILLDFKVFLKPSFDPGFYGKLIKEEIQKYLSPWAFVEGEDIVVGGKITRSAILNFVERRPYVDYVTDFELYHLYRGKDPHAGVGEFLVGEDFVIRKGADLGLGVMTIYDTFIVGEPEEEALASTARSVLVSSENHRIRISDKGSSVCQTSVTTLGMSFMRIGGDFVVGAYDYALGNVDIVPIGIGGNPAFTTIPLDPQDLRVFAEADLPNP